MTTLTSPASVTPGDDASQLFQQQQRHMGDDGQPKMEYSAYGAPQVMQGYNPDMGDGSGSQGPQSYGATGAAKEEPIYATPSESDVSGASSSAPLATLADYNQVPWPSKRCNFSVKASKPSKVPLLVATSVFLH